MNKQGFKQLLRLYPCLPVGKLLAYYVVEKEGAEPSFLIVINY